MLFNNIKQLSKESYKNHGKTQKFLFLRKNILSGVRGSVSLATDLP